MIAEIFHNPEIDFRWIDVVNPSEEEYEQLAQEYELHPAAVKDCLLPSHLPKCEQFGDISFLILRLYDKAAHAEADDVGELTNKVAIFISERFLITIHRKDAVYLSALQREWKDINQVFEPNRRHLFNEIVDDVLNTYEYGLQQSDIQLDQLEKQVFDGNDRKGKQLVWELYLLKRKTSIFRRMLQLTRKTLETFRRLEAANDPFSNDLLETTENLFFMADNLHETANNLVNLHLSLASHRTNEVMGVLTVISVFFLPLTFIVGVYGMNFHHIPELNMKYGYAGVWILMIFITISIYIWFRKKKWV